MKNKKIIIGIVTVVAIVVVGTVIFLNSNKVDTGKRDNNSGTIAITGMDSNNEGLTTINNQITKGNGGYFYCEYINGGQVIMFFDSTLKESIPICSKANCTHNDSECNAFFSMSEYILSSIYFYKNNIYTFRLKNGMAYLCKVSADGSSREEIAEIMPNDNENSLYVLFHDDCAYIYDNKGGIALNEEHTETIVKVNLNTKEVQNVYEYTGLKCAITCGKINGSKLYFTMYKYERNENSVKTEGMGIYVYDMDTDESGVVYQGNVTTYAFNNEEQAIYLLKPDEGVYKMDIASKEESLVYAADDKFMTGSISFDGNYIYLCNAGMKSSTINLDRIPKLCIVLDKDGNKIDEFAYQYNVNYMDNDYLFDISLMGINYMEKTKIGNGAEWSKLE